MSDGGGESSRKTSKAKKLGGDDFAFSIAKIAVAQVCDATGFQGIYPSALEMFSDVAVRYIHQVGKDSTFYANLSNRSESNALDIIQGLQDLGLPQGFSGASERVHCLAGSGVVQEISRYVSEEVENPFVYEVPSFPVVTERKKEPTFAQADNLPPDGHIPDWLPVFPEPKPYSQELEVDNTTKTIEPFRERKELESTLVAVDDLSQHKPCNGSEAPIPVDPAKPMVTNNPFLAPPLKFGEKKVSSVVIPLKLLDGSAMREIEDYVPCFEMPNSVAKPVNSPLKDIEEVKEKVSPEPRPKMQFKLKNLKKTMVNSPSVKINDSEEIFSLFEVSNGKHEGKRKLEQMLKESMDID